MDNTKLKFFTKRIIPIILIFIMVFSLTGCIRIGMGINVHENETVDFGITIATSNKMSESMPAAGDASMGDTDVSQDMGIKEDDVVRLKEAGYDVEEYNEDDYSGYTIIKRDVPFDEINTCLSSLNSLEDKAEGDLGSDMSMGSMLPTGQNGSISIVKNDGTYTFNVGGVGQNNTSTGDESSSDMMGGMDMGAMLASSGGFMRLTLTLPDAPINHNADEVKENEDGTNTLIWDLLKARDDDSLWATFELKKPFPIKMVVIVAIIVLVVFIIFIVLLLLVILPMLKKSKNGNVVKEKPVKQVSQKPVKNNKAKNVSTTPVNSQDIMKEPCKWCTGIEDANIRIQYCGINGKNRIVSYDREKGMIIYGIAEYCPNCGRKINYKDVSE